MAFKKATKGAFIAVANAVHNFRSGEFGTFQETFCSLDAELLDVVRETPSCRAFKSPRKIANAHPSSFSYVIYG